MSNHNPLIPNSGSGQDNHSLLSSPSPPNSPVSFTSPPFTILQLNCHNSFDVTSNALNSDSQLSILVLQEPWINPHTLKLPFYPNWTCALDSNHSPTEYSSKHRICFFFNKSFSSAAIHPIKDGSRILSAIDLYVNYGNIQKICLINLYNPPRTFEGIQKIKDWLTIHNNQHIPTFLFMDSNLHHRSWNPSNYQHTHQQSSDLIKTCG